MKNLIKRYKDWINDRKMSKIVYEAKSKNSNPRTYKVWEHKGWGDRISIRHVNKNGTFQIEGHLVTKPVVGDYIIYETSSGHKGKGMVINTEYPGDPWDMFFATVLPIEYYNED